MKNFHFGENLRIIRVAKGISQESMAIALGISQSTYCKLEKRATIPEPAMVEKICKFLGVDPTIALSGQELADLLPEITFREKAKEILDTWEGIFFYWIIQIPFVDAAYFMGEGFCQGLGTTKEVRIFVRFVTGLVAFIVSIYFFIRIKRGKN